MPASFTHIRQERSPNIVHLVHLQFERWCDFWTSSIEWFESCQTSIHSYFTVCWHLGFEGYTTRSTGNSFIKCQMRREAKFIFPSNHPLLLGKSWDSCKRLTFAFFYSYKYFTKHAFRPATPILQVMYMPKCATSNCHGSSNWSYFPLKTLKGQRHFW